MHAFVIGNVAVDETIAVSEMPAAGASILGREQSRDLGGKGCNQALVMARAGLSTTLVAAIGAGPRADFIHALLEDEPVSAHLVQAPGKPTDFSIIFTMPDGENAIVTTTDCAQSLTLADAQATLDAARPGDLVVLQGNLSDSASRDLLAAARGRGLATAFNPSPVRPFFGHLWSLVDIAFLNESEAMALTGQSGTEATRRLLATGVRQVVLTLGGKGAMLASAEETVAVDAVRGPVIDTTGAGDTFMAAALASAALRAVPLDRRAIGHAAQAAALTVGRVGTRAAFPTAAELAAILAS